MGEGILEKRKGNRDPYTLLISSHHISKDLQHRFNYTALTLPWLRWSEHACIWCPLCLRHHLQVPASSSQPIIPQRPHNVPTECQAEMLFTASK